MKNTISIVETIILKLLAERPMYGYEIIRVVLERTGGAFEWKEGTLYPWLHRLEQDGLIESSWNFSDSGKPRKYYALSKRGEAVCSERIRETRDFCETVTMLLA